VYAVKVLIDTITPENRDQVLKRISYEFYAVKKEYDIKNMPVDDRIDYVLNVIKAMDSSM
jgi:hypothetical protein